MRVAYGKLGRVARLTDPSNVGGDVEVIELLERLRADGHEVHLVTRFAGDLPAGVVDEWAEGGAYEHVDPINAEDREDLCAGKSSVRLQLFDRALHHATEKIKALEFDAWLIWLGEHNGPCWPYPKKDGSGLIRPYASRLNHVWPLVRVVNALGVVPAWLCPDPRNVQRCNNLDPALVNRRPIVGQYRQKDRGGDVEYGAIELLAAARLATSPYLVHEVRLPFGALVNEGMKDDRPLARKNLVRPWVVDLGGDLVGHWRDETCAEVGIAKPATVPVDEVRTTMSSWLATVSLPASCTGWATAKPWEAFAAGTVCFAHPAYDDKNFVYSWFDRSTRDFLRPATPAVMLGRVRALEKNPALWREIADAQRAAFADAMKAEDGGYRIVRGEMEERTK